MNMENITVAESDADHIEEMLEALADGYTIQAAEEDKQQQYRGMLRRWRKVRP